VQTRKEKIEYLRNLQAGKVKLEENPLKNIDLNNLPTGSAADLVLLKKCCDYAWDHSYPQEKRDLLFEGLVHAGKVIKLVDDETEACWRRMRARGDKL
jgi:hypothetical protein